MSYERVIPRDLFNESKLLKCLGRLCLLIHDERCNLRFDHNTDDYPGFRIEQHDYDGSFYCDNLRFYDHFGHRLRLSSCLNSKEPYPLLCTTEDDEEIEVFHDDGELTDEFTQIVGGYPDD